MSRKPFEPFSSPLLPLPRVDVDTDQITPARFLKQSRAPGGYGEILLYDWRYDEAGRELPDFVLNRPERRGATILLAGDNFGCGSSRETAVWALAEHGIRVVISTSFGDIFRNNSLKNGLLPVEVDEETHRRLFTLAEDPRAEVGVDLASAVLRLPDGGEVPFAIDPFYRECLLEGLDQMGYLLSRLPRIEAWEQDHPPSVVTTG